MRTQILEGKKQQIAQQVANVIGDVITAVIYVQEPADAIHNASDPTSFEADLDAVMALGSSNATPADVSREAIYSPEPR